MWSQKTTHSSTNWPNELRNKDKFNRDLIDVLNVIVGDLNGYAVERQAILTKNHITMFERSTVNEAFKSFKFIFI